MANPAWPSSLPGPVADSLNYRPAFDNVIRSEMDVGAKSRRRATAVPELVQMTVLLTAAQLQTLMDFYELTLKEVGVFDWVDWRKPNDSETLVAYAFRSYPQHQPWIDSDYWQVTLELIQYTTFQGTYLLDVSPLTT